MNDYLTSVAEPEKWDTIARRPRSFELEDTDTGNGALEAPFPFKKINNYYLYLSWDLCFRGAKNTCKVVVGRSDKAMAPFFDKDGKSMNNGGGTLLIQGNIHWYGAGHNSVYTFEGKT